MSHGGLEVSGGEGGAVELGVWCGGVGGWVEGGGRWGGGGGGRGGRGVRGWG